VSNRQLTPQALMVQQPETFVAIMRAEFTPEVPGEDTMKFNP
jgi:hypothetical protein